MVRSEPSQLEHLRLKADPQIDRSISIYRSTCLSNYSSIYLPVCKYIYIYIYIYTHTY